MSEHKEIKIIATISENGILTNPGVKVYIDDEQVGCIQDIKFHAAVDQISSELEITFPDLHSKYIDEEAYQKQSSNLIKALDNTINKLKSIAGIKINIIDIFKS